jgi:hypothetical protein
MAQIKQVLQYRELLQQFATVFSERSYNVLRLNESQPHNQEQMLWIACYSTLTAVVGDPDP